MCFSQAKSNFARVIAPATRSIRVITAALHSALTIVGTGDTTQLWHLKFAFACFLATHSCFRTRHSASRNQGCSRHHIAGLSSEARSHSRLRLGLLGIRKRQLLLRAPRRQYDECRSRLGGSGVQMLPKHLQLARLRVARLHRARAALTGLRLRLEQLLHHRHQGEPVLLGEVPRADLRLVCRPGLVLSRTRLGHAWSSRAK